ncbi:amidohydrolase [Exilibacterium tricleocarpae]|uniref:Amidohydrolase n=1 Tax=Exilibacterium tricleocarpae TaxID=2591008 RepID=A0A545TLD1_9GAMM|nr:amidohydrolase [Exilibacterium tricleocarpae]TQV78032.1 amidohydrolase [Exilibacterium tricleocarpae]
MPRPPKHNARLRAGAVTRRQVVKGATAAGVFALLAPRFSRAQKQENGAMADVILRNGRITTLDRTNPEAQAIAVRGGLVQAVGPTDDIMRLADSDTTVVDLGGRRVIPGLNDSHTHLIRGGLNYNMELRWEGVSSLADALRMLKAQAERTPAPQWVRVVGGWSEFQFAERRMPTLGEINAAAPQVPVFILHLYGRALLNRAALRALGITKTTPNPRGGLIEKDAKGEPTGMLIANPSALILYSTLAQGPKLPLADQINSTRHYMREMNRLGITSVIDAGGGGQNFPDDYTVIQRLHDAGQLTVRIAYNLFAQTAGEELSDYERWIAITEPGAGSAMLRMNGAGENLTWSAADFENFLEPRPDLAPHMERELESIVELLATHKWPFRIHATYDESIDRFLTVFERVNGKKPFETRFIIDHAETIGPRNIERIKALGGGIATQHRMAFQGEYFVARYGKAAAKATPPIAKMLAMEVPVGGGTDATRVASYDPWVALYWLTTGRTPGGLALYDAENVLSREEALRIWTQGSAWFSGEADVKGALTPGQYADLAVLSADYMRVPAQEIRRINSVLTMTAGRVVYGEGDFTDLSPPLPPASPDWSPVHTGPSPAQRAAAGAAPQFARACHDGCAAACGIHGHNHRIAWDNPIPVADKRSFWGALGCSCFAV